MLQRVVVCMTNNMVDFVIGPFVDHNHVEDFLEEHKKICKRHHIQRKLNPENTARR